MSQVRWPLLCGLLSLAVLALAFTVSQGAVAPASQWARLDAAGHLEYKSLERGDRLMDFSFAGYHGGGVALPSAAVKLTLGPPGTDDDTVAIQAGIDAVSQLELAGGLRGAVLLQRGTYHCRGTLAIEASGVVLRGAGSGSNGTTIEMTGPPHLAISISGTDAARATGKAARITQTYVPSGATGFEVESTDGLQAGDTVLIHRPVTPAWVHFMGMDGLTRNGKKENWLSAPGEIIIERALRGVSTNALLLDIPLPDSLDSAYLAPTGASVVKAVFSGRLSETGVESLRIVSPPQAVEISERHNQAVRMNGLTDGWLKDLMIRDTVNSVSLGSHTRRVTVEDVRLEHTVATQGSAKPADLATDGSQVLFDRCAVRGDNLFYFATGGRVTGPNVLLNCTFHGNGHLQPHMRWATGLLVDNCRIPEGGIDFMNRGEMGSGHGWAIGWAVAWNCAAKSFLVQQPPGAMNWAIGCTGARQRVGMPFGHQPDLLEGICDSPGVRVEPASLYLAQLAERLGAQAIKAIGYEQGLAAGP